MLKKIPELVAELRQHVPCLTAQEAAAKCKALQGVLIDVREPSEFVKQPAQGAVNIPRGVLEMQATVKFPDATTPIFIHCATGGRATFAAEQLQRVGYQNVWAITCNAEVVVEAQLAN